MCYNEKVLEAGYREDYGGKESDKELGYMVDKTSEKEEERVIDVAETIRGAPICEECAKLGFKNEAKGRVGMGGQERWLCESCLRAAGYEH